jgi:hypothetical protein
MSLTEGSQDEIVTNYPGEPTSVSSDCRRERSKGTEEKAL